MKKLIEAKRGEFLLYLEEIRGYSDLTIKSYDESLKEAFRYVEVLQEGGHTLLDLMPYRIKISSLNPKTISKKLSAIRSFAEYLNDNNIRVVLKADESVKVAKTLPKPIAHKHIIEAISDSDLRDKLVVTLLYTLGLRISELASLRVNDISTGWIRVIGKGNKQRDVPLLANAKELLDAYLSTTVQKKFVFEKNGEKLSQNSLRYIVTNVFRRVGLKVTPHQLRHSYASSLLNGRAPIADVSELLGHSSMATTQIYTKLGSALKQENYNSAHPLCGASE
ncbi:MAG: tyrosine-type recombinase/integrase [Sulfurimonas sp.]|uniref:tyrosine-type recombinase/integrase n=1 Tax=Sulfurimonas sp. TaxID=2022749 RepID=UPI0028CC12B2|nr:tyrosine-type recombinase/integrase [Sulfurimonas sp.]MDT8339274.1 tyrosine-type recombinase/integrase [Sulfurimonas sp.]